ncbi:MAG: hypothetical protein HY300_08695 [Verrucomicrobia bacterium]|nr:hypothetical protein [Verrucomicrobiota bacterium]
MQTQIFLAETAAEAVAQIREQLGPDAIVVDVRRKPADGLARLWQPPRIEVLACRPAAPASNPIADLRQEIASLRAMITGHATASAASSEGEPGLRGAEGFHSVDSPVAALGEHEPEPAATLGGSPAGAHWRIGRTLESTGLLPLHAQRVIERLQAIYGGEPPETFGAELSLVRAAMSQMWRPSPTAEETVARPHVFVGPAGSGKTTALCKWLAQAVLLDERLARVWRLDGSPANTAESLSVHCEILGVPVERSWDKSQPPPPGELLFVDLPGVNWTDAAAVRELGSRVAALPSPELHLVLNGAYETPVLLAQARAFAALPVSDVIVTHLDEEPRWGKLWNLALGTDYPIRFLGTGQNIPGDFYAATPERVFARQFGRK